MTLPHDPALEARALAAVMIDPEQWAEVAALPAEAFHTTAGRGVFELMAALHADGEPVDDPALILSRAATHPQHRTYVTGNYLQGVMTSDATAFYAASYTRELRALHARRETMRAAQLVMQHAQQGDLSAEDLATLASRVALPLDARSRTGFTSHADALSAAMADIDAGEVHAISTGFTDLDAAILGFEPGALYVLAARPAMGKSALGYSFALNAAKVGRPVAVGSLEMPAKALTTRALATAASVDLDRIRHRTLTTHERTRLASAHARLRPYPVTYMDATDQTGLSIARDARTLRAQGKLDLLLIDYLQLIESGKTSENRQQEVSAISRNLKKLALELEIPVVVLSQLSRNVEARPNKRPLLSDLRESGAIEQDADTVMFIYRDEYYNPQTDKQGQAEIIIAKQRSGPVSSVDLSYSSEFVRFGNLTRYGEVSHAAD